jgi:OmpA-OmpF porin, OOP family
MKVLLGAVIALEILAILYLGSLTGRSTTAVQTQPPAAFEVNKAPSVQLPTFRADSTEQKLAVFLSDPSAVINQENGTWFDFDQVNFATGSSALSDSSMEQLKNVVVVMKLFPNATFKIGGYTDNVGKPDVNKKLSQDRATSVFEQLKKLGIPETQLTGAEGFGSEHPIADNATEEGRAKNRRMSVRVKSK